MHRTLEPFREHELRRLNLTAEEAEAKLMAIEDAMVLARCIKESGDHIEAFARYERARVERTHLVQVESDARGARLQTHTPDKYDNKEHRNDEDLGLFDYDAMTVPI